MDSVVNMMDSHGFICILHLPGSDVSPLPSSWPSLAVALCVCVCM